MRLLIVAALVLPGVAAAFTAGPESPVMRADDDPAPMDMVWSATDTNGVPLNSQWGLQVTEPGSLPNAAEICFSLPGYFENPECSTQHPPQDTGTGLTGLTCSIGAQTPIAGHVNWYPSTVEGPIYWDSLSFFDRDYNVRVVPPTQNGLTAHNPDNIKGEFDSRETINTFSTPWWAAFREASDAAKRGMINGKPAIVSGLMGIDCQHDCPSELHPVWVLAIHVQDDPRDDMWAVFTRNWGNEGMCSHLQHEVNWARNRFTLVVPWRDGATGVGVERGTRFMRNMGGIRGWVREVPGDSVRLTFALPPPSARGMVHGELHLRWTGGTTLDRPGESNPDGPTAPPAPAEWTRQGGEAEALLEELAARLSPDRRRLFERDVRQGRAFIPPLPLPLRRATEADEADASAAASVTSRPDPAHAAAEERRLRALLNAIEGDIPGPLGEALEQRTRKP